MITLYSSKLVIISGLLSGVSTQRNVRDVTQWRHYCIAYYRRQRPITAASDDGVCRWHAAKLW